MKIVRSALAAAALAGLGLSAQAATVSLSSITGTWFDANPAANASYGGSNTANPTVRWGTTNPQSGYNFNAVANASADVPPSPSSDFDLGTFTHLNNPIPAGTSITDVKLRVTANVMVDATDFGSRSFEFLFTHFETPNDADPCADGNPRVVPPNQNGCADRVTVSFLNSSESFDVNGDIYTINIVGFKIGGNTFTEFWTAERQDNSATLVANVTLRSAVIPEPGALALAGIALLGAAAARRRRG